MYNKIIKNKFKNNSIKNKIYKKLHRSDTNKMGNEIDLFEIFYKKSYF